MSGETDSIVDIVRERGRILQQIAQGIFDGNEDMIFEAVKRRRKTVDLMKASSFQVGDNVTFNGTARPKYLLGVEGTVTDIGMTSVSVQMPPTIPGDKGGRFVDPFTGMGAVVRCPVSIVESV